MKLSRFGPKSRVVFITAVALMLALTVSTMAFGRELRVYNYVDLARCAGTWAFGTRAIAVGPDAGQISAAGDTCVVMPGVYTAADLDGDVDTDPIYVTLENITIRSANGALATIITGGGIAPGDATDPDGAGPLPPIAEVGVIVIMADGVMIGGPKADQGLTIQGGPPGVSGIAIGPAGTMAGQADEGITIQNNIIRANGLNGTSVLTLGSLELFKFLDNTIRENVGAGIFFAP